MRKLKLYKYACALPHIHDSIPEYYNSVPFSEQGIKDHCEIVDPDDAEFFYCGQFADKDRSLLSPHWFAYFKGNESRHIFDLEGDHSDSFIPPEFRRCLFTAMNATIDKRDWNLLVRPPCSKLLMDMVKHPREILHQRKFGACFIGKRDSRGIREQMFKDLVERNPFPIHWAWTDKWNGLTPIDQPEVISYESQMMQWTMALCPPGEGQATVRFYEACGLNMLPIYYGSGLTFMHDLRPPTLSPLDYFDEVIRYFNDPTEFFIERFNLLQEKAA